MRYSIADRDTEEYIESHLLPTQNSTDDNSILAMWNIPQVNAAIKACSLAGAMDEAEKLARSDNLI